MHTNPGTPVVTPKIHFAGLSTTELHRARAAYLQGNECPELEKVRSEVSTLQAETGSDRDHTANELDQLTEKQMDTVLEVPESLAVKTAAIDIQRGLTDEMPSTASYYDDERDNYYELPYNLETVKKGVATLLASGDNSWLKKPFVAMESIPDPAFDSDWGSEHDVEKPDGLTPTDKEVFITGRDLLERLSVDLKYPEDIEILHLIALHIPNDDPYWKESERIDPATQEKVMFPGGGPSSRNIAMFTCYNEIYGVSPASLENIVRMTQDISKKAEAVTGKDDPLGRLECIHFGERYFEDLANHVTSPAMGNVLKDYLKDQDLHKVATTLQKMDELEPRTRPGSNLCSHYAFIQIVHPDPTSPMGKEFLQKITTAIEKKQRDKEKSSDPVI